MLELGYAAHVADDPLSNGTKAQQIAVKLIDDLMRLTAASDSDDAAYLFKARGIVLSLSRGIARRKVTYRADIDAANAYRALQLSRIDTQRTQSMWTTLVYRTALSGGIGFALMESFLPFVHLHSQHGGEPVTFGGLAPSMLMALIFAAGSKLVSSKMEDFRYRAIFEHYEWIRFHAVQRYENGKLKEFERNHVEIRRHWQEYTGRTPPDTITFGTVIAEDVRTQEWMEHERQREMASAFSKLLIGYRSWRDNRRQALQPSAAK